MSYARGLRIKTGKTTEIADLTKWELMNVSVAIISDHVTHWKIQLLPTAYQNSIS